MIKREQPSAIPVSPGRVGPGSAKAAVSGSSGAAASSSGVGAVLTKLLKSGDIVMALLVVSIVFMLIIPMPPFLLDLLLVSDFALALTVLVVAIQTEGTVQFSTFPSVLLILTLFRLSLNVSTTRQILLNGYAGHVVDAFGRFVVGGNIVVGLVVFLILALIQFVVITNGANRIAEVAARFTLDAMPGRQMAVDADLNAGLIGEDEARQRREEIRHEADFHGAMDGASKFVRGDAIASLIITAINLIGGLAIGVMQQHMSLPTALETFSILTVGDGLVSQIPALLLSTAAGILVSRANTEGDLGKATVKQLFNNPKSIAVVAAVILALSVVPGMPIIPFLAIGAILAGTAYTTAKRTKSAAVEEAPAAQTEATPAEQATAIEPLELAVGYALIPLVNAGQGEGFLGRILALRRQVSGDLGVAVPPVRVRDNMSLPANTYSVRMWGEEVAKGEVYPGHLLALSQKVVLGSDRLVGKETTDPVFGLPALWVSETERESAESAGYTFIDPVTVILTHLSEVVRHQAAELLTRQDVRKLLDKLGESYPAVLEELTPNLLTVGQVHQVLRGLLRENIPIRDVLTIAQAMADAAHEKKSTDHLLEAVRRALARTITNQYRDDNGTLNVTTLHPSLEMELMEGLHRSGQGSGLAVAPETVQRLLTEARQGADRLTAAGHAPVLLCTSALRFPLRQIIERRLPTITVLAVDEVMPQTPMANFAIIGGESHEPATSRT